jgi:hypothetical protein
VQVLIQEHAISVRQACRAARLARSAYYAPRRARDDSALITAIQGFVAENPGQGFDKLYPVLRTQGFGKCRLYRVYKALKLNLKRRGKRRLPARVKAPLVIPAKPNEIWSADFMSDALWSGRRFRPSTSSTTAPARRYASRSIPICQPNASCAPLPPQDRHRSSKEVRQGARLRWVRVERGSPMAG